MNHDRCRPGGYRPVTTTVTTWPRASRPVSAALALTLAVTGAGTIRAQQPDSAASPLVFDGVTVVDVERGTLLPDQRVVIAGNHIRALGNTRTTALPPHARVVNARGEYLIPGLWDMHISPSRSANLYYPRLLAYGITGIRNAGAPVPLDTLRLWRQEILAGTRVGPPRQLLTARLWEWDDKRDPCFRNPPPEKRSNYLYICVKGAEHARHVVDSLKAVGSDMITVTGASPETYFAMIAEARRVGLPFGGKDGGGHILAESDSGALIVDDLPTQIVAVCVASETASVERCRQTSERFRRNGTWVTAQDYVRSTDSHDTPTTSPKAGTEVSSLRLIQQVGFPLLAMSYVRGDYSWERNLPGSTLHETLADFVARGLTPLAALQTATINPAQALRATDTLGTVAVGKLADLVLLDANPLTDIGNTTKIRAVVANGRYFDRVALDRLLADVAAKAKAERP